MLENSLKIHIIDGVKPDKSLVAQTKLRPFLTFTRGRSYDLSLAFLDAVKKSFIFLKK